MTSILLLGISSHGSKAPERAHEKTIIRMLAELYAARLQASQQTPLIVFHMVDAEQFASRLRFYVPEIEFPGGDKEPNYEHLELPLSAGDRAVQRAALQAGPAVRYVLVVVNVSELGKTEPLTRKRPFRPVGWQGMSHPTVWQWREQALLMTLEQSLTSEAGTDARAKVLLLDTEAWKNQCTLWKYWAECICN